MAFIIGFVFGAAADYYLREKFLRWLSRLGK